jgi:F0F1-type ATP synthase assembly protein I
MWTRGTGAFLGLGIQLALAVIVFFFAGRWLDAKFGTSPWLMLAGLLLGITGGLIQFVRAALELGKKQDRKNGER